MRSERIAQWLLKRYYMNTWKFWKKNKAPAGNAAPAPAAAQAGGLQAQAAAMGNQGTQQIAAMMGRAGQQAEENARVPEAAPNESLEQMYNVLVSRKSSVTNDTGDKLYMAAIESLKRVNSEIRGGFTNSPKENQEKLVGACSLYRQLIESCSRYISRDHLTFWAKRRCELVTKVLDQAQKDLVSLEGVRTDFCTLPPEEQASKTWRGLLSDSRSLHISVKNYAAIRDKNKAQGGQASEVVTLSGGNATVKNARGESIPLNETFFFKPEDEIDLSQKTTAQKISANVMARYSKLTSNDKKIILQWCASGNSFVPDKVMKKLSTEGKAAIQNILSNMKGTQTTIDELLTPMGISDQKVNMTRRNVATSRVAALLGLGNLVAESQTAEITDESTGQTMRGNVMKKSRYTTSGAEYRGKHMMKIEKNDAKAFGEGREIDMSLNMNVTGGFQRDMCNLQVLDAICGQQDRHENNFFVGSVGKNDDQKLSGVQGIDNDGAFGMGDNSLKQRPEGHAAAIYDKNGNMSIPFMDKNLAQRIELLDPETIRFALKDLLTDDEINATIRRLDKTRNAIERQRMEDPSRLLEDDEWNDDTAQRLIDDSWEKIGRFNSIDNGKEAAKVIDDTKLQQNYFGKYMISSVGNKIYAWNYGKTKSPQIRRKQQ